MDKQILVYADLAGTPYRVGRLWTHARARRESATFEYDASWLDQPLRFALEPALHLGPGPFHTGADGRMFGAIGDSAPDRWGRALMRRRERRLATTEGRTPRTLTETDYLLQVDDEARLGALRFRESVDGPFLREAVEGRIPPLVDVGRLLAAADRVADDRDTIDDLKLLLAPGSSLGGARPKASVRDRDGALAIAKFPHRDDDWDAVRWEWTALTLARRAGLDVAEARIEAIGERAVLIVQRFDRVGAHRVPYLSAMSLLGAQDHETRSYLELADALRQHGAEPDADCRALWRRMVFTVLVSNTDDHLRNHGLLLAGPTGWRLSPMFDVNPVPVDVRPRELSTAITEHETTASLALAFNVASHFGVSRAEASAVARDVGAAVATWHEVAASAGLSMSAIDRMRSAFEHDDLELALRS